MFNKPSILNYLLQSIYMEIESIMKQVFNKDVFEI